MTFFAFDPLNVLCRDNGSALEALRTEEARTAPFSPGRRLSREKLTDCESEDGSSVVQASFLSDEDPELIERHYSAELSRNGWRPTLEFDLPASSRFPGGGVCFSKITEGPTVSFELIYERRPDEVAYNVSFVEVEEDGVSACG